MKDADISDENLRQKVNEAFEALEDLVDQKPSFELLSGFFRARIAADAMAKRKVLHGLAVAGLKIMELRARTGALPKTLAGAGVEAKEPILGHDIRYDVLDDAFCLWTPGPDGKDCGSRLRENKILSLDDIHLTWPPDKSYARRSQPAPGGAPAPSAPPGSPP
jgi:hypothetical protein